MSQERKRTRRETNCMADEVAYVENSCHRKGAYSKKKNDHLNEVVHEKE
jgi:hypothetical protein